MSSSSGGGVDCLSKVIGLHGALVRYIVKRRKDELEMMRQAMKCYKKEKGKGRGCLWCLGKTEISG